MEVVDRFFKAPRQSFFLLGPRGTGKTLWTKRAFPKALRFDLLQPELVRQMAARPERLRAAVEGSPRTHTVIIDEVQKVPQLLDVVHALIEERKSLRFVLTGSSARKLRRGGVDLLAGRAVMRALHPFMAGEVGGFDLDAALGLGMLPLVRFAKSPRDVLRTYTALYVREEVQLEALVKNVGSFARFLEAISFSHGALLNVSNVARECEVERKTVEGYVGVLEDLLLAFRLPVFARRAKRALVVHEKIYLFDAGVFRSLRPSGPLDRSSEIDGAALEGLVAQHLRAWIDYRGRGDVLHYWRTRSGVEVDFVMYGPSGLVAIDVMHQGNVRPADTKSLRAFLEDYPEARAVLLYRGRERLRYGTVDCVPVGEWLAELRPGRRIA
jgi:predicted AAA+ superfamily ATPase